MDPTTIAGCALWTLACLQGPLPTSDAGGVESADDAAGERGRAELRSLVQRCRDGVRPPEGTELRADERALGLELSAVQEGGVRVLARGGVEEARDVASALAAALAVFHQVAGMKPEFPEGCRAFLLSGKPERETFLNHLRGLSAEQRRWISSLEGAGIPGTADWAHWSVDPDERRDGLVRFAFDWFFRTGPGVSNERHAWLHEGLGIYLTHALVGTRLTWFVPPRERGTKADDGPAPEALDLPGVDWFAATAGLFAPAAKFDLEELFHLEPSELERDDYLRAHALAAYLMEVRPADVPAVLRRVGAGDDPREVLEETLGFSLKELRTRLDDWLSRRESLVAKAEGRRSEAELRKAWNELNVAKKKSVTVVFRRRLNDLDTAQMRAIRAALAKSKLAPKPAEELAFYDPAVHAPGLPIARKRLADEDKLAKKLLAEVRKPADPRAPIACYAFDWLSGRVVSRGDPEAPETVFHNALLGLAPGADLARARALEALASPEEAKLQAAFAHAYTDREGNVFPISLFEAWGSGITMEMPDVDVLGIVHDVLNEWKKWVSPVPGEQHEGLYGEVRKLYLRCRRSRELRTALADAYLQARPVPVEGYESHLTNLQSLWAESGSDAPRLRASLPEGTRWEEFMTRLSERGTREHEFYALGARRGAELRADGDAVRRVLGDALDEVQAREKEKEKEKTKPGAGTKR